jgi:glycosyltransferase involved in cell wall biosynthesis
VVEAAPLRVLTVHNYYQQPGGEDRAFEMEGRLLEEYGNEVIRFSVHNDRIAEHGPAWLARRLFWNSQVYDELRAIIRERRPDILHAHNTFPLLSPAAYAAAHDSNVPVVQTLHNFRLLCANAQLYRDGHVCEDCVGRRLMWPAVVHRCYRGSALASTAVVAMLHYQRVRRPQVDVYIAMTEFMRSKMAANGLPADRIVVKPNFVADTATARDGDGDFMLFVGRLSVEKGIPTLLAAWRDAPDLPPLRIAGDGPLRGDVEAAARTDPRVQMLGRQSRPQLADLLAHARALVFPSEWYEGMPLVILEAYAMAVPVIGAAVGTAAIVENGTTGLHYAAGSAVGLAERVRWAWQYPAEMRAMGGCARQRYEREYTPTVNYGLLRAIYARALAA